MWLKSYQSHHTLITSHTQKKLQLVLERRKTLILVKEGWMTMRKWSSATTSAAKTGQIKTQIQNCWQSQVWKTSSSIFFPLFKQWRSWQNKSQSTPPHNSLKSQLSLNEIFQWKFFTGYTMSFLIIIYCKELRGESQIFNPLGTRVRIVLNFEVEKLDHRLIWLQIFTPPLWRLFGAETWTRVVC